MRLILSAGRREGQVLVTSTQDLTHHRGSAPPANRRHLARQPDTANSTTLPSSRRRRPATMTLWPRYRVHVMKIAPLAPSLLCVCCVVHEATVPTPPRSIAELIFKSVFAFARPSASGLPCSSGQRGGQLGIRITHDSIRLRLASSFLNIHGGSLMMEPLPML